MNKILAFDSAGTNLVVFAKNGRNSKEIKRIASGTENLLPTIDEALKAVGLTIGEVELVCVGVGPGSWTGARVAVTTALGLAAGNKNLKFSTFNSFDLISYNGSEQKKVAKLVKAYANFIYLCADGEIKAITKEELKQAYADYVWVGDGEILDGVQVCGGDIKNAIKPLISGKKIIDPSQIEPMYLRLSQAEYQRMGKIGADRK